MKRENKKKARNATQEIFPASQEDVENHLSQWLSCSVHSVILDCKGFLHCVVKGLSVFLKYAKPLFSSVRYINNAETGARTYSQS